jgi:hypothetical protein
VRDNKRYRLLHGAGATGITWVAGAYLLQLLWNLLLLPLLGAPRLGYPPALGITALLLAVLLLALRGHDAR